MTSVVDSMAHVSQTLKDFGPLQNYSTFNFENTVGSIVQSVNGPTLVVSELINNLNILQCATAQLNDIPFSTSIKLFIRRLFSSKQLAFPNQQSINKNKSVRLGRKFKPSNDHIVMTYLHNSQISNFSLHQTCWKNNVQFSIYESSSTSKNSDSCVLFKDKHEIKCGFIMAIIYDMKQQCNMVLHTVSIDQQDSFTFKKKTVVNPFIFWGQLSDPRNMVTIPIDDIIVKLAYSKQDIFHFFQFPNIVEST
ncbi:unnamed protein product [Rotaria sp. Silwood2]|nr:unnamed protein product [Rotaria sp. Silwood2]CAF4466497.1 unnamed protein product [Rotaria sp. Silwood2]